MTFLQPLVEFINSILSYFYQISGDYGLAIIMLTALVNVVTFPLTRKQIQSSRKLQEVQPELKKIQEKYKNDKEKQNQATMEFMKEKKVNPLGGCLPLLVQFPILISIFQLLRDPSIIEGTVEVFDPYFLFFNLDLTQPDPYYILPIMAALGTFLHQRMVLTDPRQKMLMYIFPVLIVVISVGFPAGLVLYWLTNSFFNVGNHFIIKKVEGSGKKEEPTGETKKTEKEKPAEEVEEKGASAGSGGNKSTKAPAQKDAKPAASEGNKTSKKGTKSKKGKKGKKKKGAG